MQFVVQIDIYGVIGISMSIAAILILAYLQNSPWWLWIMWITSNFFWFAHYIIFSDLISLIMTCIFFVMNVIGLFRNLTMRKKKKRKTKRKKRSK